MTDRTATQKLLAAPAPEVHVLDVAKAARLRAKTMLMPSPLQVQTAIRAIPFGETRTLRRIRDELARESQADITCPVAARRCWVIVAYAAEERREAGDSSITPWWRVTRAGAAYGKLPGGEANHLALLTSEHGAD